MPLIGHHTASSRQAFESDPMRRTLMLASLLLLPSFGWAGGTPPPAPGQTFQEAPIGTLYAGKAKNGIDFNVWFDPTGGAPARLLLNPKVAFPQNSLALGATFGRGHTVYALVQHAYSKESADQVIYAIDRVTLKRTKVVAMRDLGLQLALGEKFHYDLKKDRLVFSALHPERNVTGQVSHVQHIYGYGPMQKVKRTLTQP